ncbi:sensor histidine kinase [Deferrisoma camini]|uniref:sensor histidine kinase n=1 Tax=Deferrisoma camini TaxID=1035120 RepID=UPI00046D01E4|nr:ATP-binding protein [Deferrisoma camini]
MFRTSLSVKINLAIVAVLGLVLGGATWFNLMAQDRQAVENTKSQARILSKTLTNIIRIDMEGRCQKDVMKVIRMMGQFQDIETIRIFNADGIIMHSAQPGEIGKEVDELVYNVFTSPDRSKPFRSEERGHRSFCMVEVMYNEPRCHTCHDPNKEIVGVLEVCLSMAKTGEHIRQNARFMVGSTVVTVLLVTGAISFLLHRMVNRPVRELAETMKEVERGNLEVRTRVRGRDELGRLARSFNSMIARLDEASREVERLHREQMMRAERLASIGEMAASVAHEIKNPLAGLAGATQVLAQGFEPDDPRMPVVQEMLKLIDRLDKTIRDLLSFARESVPNWQRANPNDVVEESLFFVEREEGGTRDQVELVLDPEMPEITMDPQQIQQVLLNLILNARHAVGGRGRIEVCTSARPTLEGEGAPEGPDWVEVLVRDDGPGIPPEKLSEIFKPFYTTKNQGTGLGLPICRKIVEAHGGRIHVRSQVGAGSEFYVWLPRTQGEET